MLQFLFNKHSKYSNYKKGKDSLKKKDVKKYIVLNS